MKKIILKLLYIISSVLNKIFYRKNKVQANSILNKVKIRGTNNKIVLLSGRSSKIVINGSNNCICIKGYLKNCVISINSSNSEILIGESNIFNSEFIVLDDFSLIKLGDRGYIGGARFFSAGKKNKIEIGDNFLFSDKIEFWNSDTHSLIENGLRINPDKPINVDDNVWIGTGALILKGVNIGKDSVIAANSIVTKNVVNNTLVGGTPATKIKENISWKFERI